MEPTMELNLRAEKILIILITINCLLNGVQPKDDDDDSTSNTIDSYKVYINIIIIISVIIVLCILAACAVAGYYVIKKINRRKVPEQATLILDSVTTTPKTIEQVCQKYSIRIYNSDQVKCMENIGNDSFGEVFQGELFEKKVTVKKTRSKYSAFVIQEVEALGALSHDNILSLIGIFQTTDWELPGLIFELMEFGNLQHILRESNPKLDESNPSYRLTHDKLGIVAWQIANGMKYLSSKFIVHRDLATRNCLMSSKGEIKISDFALSRDVYYTDYYKIPDWNLAKGTNRRLPLRWLSPENLRYGSFTVESDVWTYGMVLIEIYTWGSLPYSESSDQETCAMILAGETPSIPETCPLVVEQIMKGCWIVQPKCRITFHQICDKFEHHPELTQYSKTDPPVQVQTDDSGYLVPG